MPKRSQEKNEAPAFHSRKPHIPHLFMARWPQTYGLDFCRGVWGQRRWVGCWLSTNERMEERRSEQLEVHSGGGGVGGMVMS